MLNNEIIYLNRIKREARYYENDESNIESYI